MRTVDALVADTRWRSMCTKGMWHSGFREHSSIQREACFDQADVKVEKDIVTFNGEKGEDS